MGRKKIVKEKELLAAIADTEVNISVNGGEPAPAEATE